MIMFNSIFFILTNHLVQSMWHGWEALPTGHLDKIANMPTLNLSGQDSPSFGTEPRGREEYVDLEANNWRGDVDLPKSPIGAIQTQGPKDLIQRDEEADYTETIITQPNLSLLNTMGPREKSQGDDSSQSEAPANLSTETLAREPSISAPGSRELRISSRNEQPPSSGNGGMVKLAKLALAAGAIGATTAFVRTHPAALAIPSKFIFSNFEPNGNMLDTPGEASTTESISAWGHLPQPTLPASWIQAPKPYKGPNTPGEDTPDEASTTESISTWGHLPPTPPASRIQAPKPYEGPFPSIDEYSPICQSHAKWLQENSKTMKDFEDKFNKVVYGKYMNPENPQAELAYYIGHSDDPNREDCQIVS